MSDMLVKLRRQAEKSVKDMKDGPLKEKAFETILTHLLSANHAQASSVQTGAVRPRVNKIGAPHRTVSSSGGKSGPTGYVELLAAEGFFKKPRTIADVRAALRDQGHSYPNTTLSPILVRLTRKRVLRRTREKLADKKAGFTYSNW